MNILPRYLTLALGVSGLLQIACAQECETTSTIDQATGEKILRLASPDQLAIFEGCDTIIGHILIGNNYSGDFILNGVTEFRGSISTEAPERSHAQTLGLVQLLNVTDIGNMSLYGLIDDVRLPNLQKAGDVVLGQTSPGTEVDLGSLVEASNVKIQGSWTRSLKTVGQVLEVSGSYDRGIHPGVAFPYLEIDFPSLRTTNELSIFGAVKSVSFPHLEVVGFQEPYPTTYQGLSLSINGMESTLDFNAPKLHTLNGSLGVYGDVSGLSLGALGKTTLAIIVNTDVPVNIYSTIKSAKFFYLWGVLQSIHLPNFIDMGDFGPAYEPAIPCNETLYRLWASLPHNYSPSDGRCTRSNATHYYKGPGTRDQSTSNDNQHTNPDYDKSKNNGGPSSNYYAKEDQNSIDNKNSNNNNEDITLNNPYPGSHVDSTNDNIDSEAPTGSKPYAKWPWPVSVGLDMLVQSWDTMVRLGGY
ncbi:uncharacterized protein TRUGW13939_05693 [Talaromyces rugulosus]|uniref:Receptor L-domain domain-containing protein n=1 Tax=Talaromyces rugulosus TaxID=121627 RepID=A0A7H8QY17_TALRU|nr:uncharacterized protein TRUGW13939_05693 [Talaromyces rugulosus]QKX58568.1 hypothetical protein TRUGW13939_05693 [Talaromyces rugulosus]